MKHLEMILINASKNMAISALKRDANATTCTIVYQPKAPIDLKKFSKIK